jgi:hypothetical protein
MNNAYHFPSLYSNRPIPLDWKEFFKGNIIPKYEKDQIVELKSYFMPLAFGLISSTSQTIPAAKITPEAAIQRAAEPIERMVIAIAKPVTVISTSWGCIECATGHPASGIQRIKFALLGYASIRWLRLLIDAIGPY